MKKKRNNKISEEQFRHIYENMAVGVAQVSMDFRIKNANKAYCQMLGYSEEELIGKHLKDFTHPEVIEENLRKQSELANGIIDHYRMEKRFIHKSGRIVHGILDASLIRNDDDEPLYFLGSVSDITERKKIEKALEKSQRGLLRSQYIAKMGDFTWNIEKGTFAWSDGMYKLLKYDKDEKIDYEKVNTEIHHPDDLKRVTKWFIESIESGKEDLTPNEYRLICKDGEIIYVQTKGKIEYQNGKALKVFGTCQDITHLIEIRKELFIAKEKAEESDRLKSAFLANMSHEIRTPMNGILGFAELLREPLLTGEQLEEYIGLIEESGIRMLNIINDLIDISKVESGQMNTYISEININEQLRYLYTFFKPETESKGLELSFKNTLPDDDAVLNSDREKIYAILTNLVKNAIKFTYEGFIELGYEEKGESIEFFVKDTGIGISDEEQRIVFDRFVQADMSLSSHYEGAGLGLSISKAYVEMLGGEIRVESEEGEGTIFYFTIPFDSGQKVSILFEEKKSEKKLESKIKNLKILVVEDDEISAAYLTGIVKSMSKEILRAVTGVEAVEFCKKNSDIDLILMDIRMPEMDGYEATEKIRKFNKDVLIIAQTAYALTGDREKAINVGCDDYISKPVKKNELILRIEKHLK